MASTALLGLFKALQQGQRERSGRRDKLGGLFEKGMRPREGMSGFNEPRTGVGGFLESMFGGGPRIDYSQFEAPPALVGGPRGEVSRVGDQGRGDVETVREAEPRPGIAVAPGTSIVDPVTGDPIHEGGKYGDPEAREVKDGDGNVVGWQVGQVNPAGKFEGTLVQKKTGTSKGLQTVTLPDGSQATFDPNNGTYVKPDGTPVDPESFEKPEEDRGATEGEAATKMVVNLQNMLEGNEPFGDLKLTGQQRKKLNTLLNDIIFTMDDVTRDALGIDFDAVAAARGDIGGPEAKTRGTLEDALDAAGKFLDTMQEWRDLKGIGRERKGPGSARFDRE